MVLASVSSGHQPSLKVALQRLCLIKTTSGGALGRSFSSTSSFPTGVSAMNTSPATSQRAPWRDILDSHLQQTPGYEFTIATIGYDARNRPVPRLRTCGCRGFFPELELHPKGQEAMDEQVEGGGNPPVFESDMLCFTTDARMEKLPQLESSGNAIEAVFWLQDLMTQWRIKGTAYAIGDPTINVTESEKASREKIMKGLRVKGNNDRDIANWTWDKAVTKYFANHSPVARGSFRNPQPGMSRSQSPGNPALSLGQKVTDLHDHVSRNNFRVVVICPEEVERLDLTNQEDGKRWKWILGEGGANGSLDVQWNETEVWP